MRDLEVKNQGCRFIRRVKRCSPRWRTMIAVAIFVSLHLLTLPVSSHAEFVRVGSMYQTARTRVLAVRDRENSGILIVDGPERAVQLFDLSTYPERGSRSVFLRYDPIAHAYSEVITLGATHKVTGSFRLVMGSTRVTLDALSNSTPYLSVVDRGGEAPGLLGVVGLSVAVNASGTRAVTLLEAQLPTAAGGIDDYVLNEDGSFTVSSSPLTTDRIGVVAEIKNPCREQSAIVLNAEDSELIRKRLREQNVEPSELQAIIRRNAERSPFADLIMLAVNAESIVGFHYETGHFMVIRPLDLSGTTEKLRPLCTMSAVEVTG